MAETCRKCDGLMIQFKAGYYSSKEESYPYWDIYRCDCWPADLLPKPEDSRSYTYNVNPDYPVVTGAKGGVTLARKEEGNADARRKDCR